MRKQIYIAGPFFNPAQIKIIDEIETVFRSANVHGPSAFSPRLANPTAEGTKITSELAKKIFWENVESIRECDALIAVLDYAFPVGQRLMLSKRSPEGFVGLDPLNLPDSGTVWEMGMAFALDKPIFIYQQNESQKQNIMLTQCVDGVIQGKEALWLFLKDGTIGDYSTKNLKKWKGEYE